jgi:HK97 gp10 family phage protein
MAIQLTGVHELRRAIEALPKELKRTVESSALRAGMTPVRKSAAANLSRSMDTGLLKKSLGLTVKKTRKGQLTARVGARSGFTQTVTRKGRSKPEKVNPVKYAHLVEYGTSKAPAKPFIRPAVESNSGAILEGMAKGYAKGMDRVVRKIRSKA